MAIEDRKALMHAPDLVIFDCDGVLIDSEVIACRVDAACFAEIGLPITAEDVMERYVGTSARTMFADIEARHGVRLPEDFGLTLRERIAAAFETELKAMDGIEAVLDALPCARCVASSSAPDRLRHALSLTELLGRFDPHVFSATQVPRGKPAPDLFLFAAQRMGVAPARCVVVEDSMPGVEAGVAAGMRVLGFTGGGHCRPEHAERLRAAGAADVFCHMRELPRLARQSA
jgi:HAD superfamily hydrolase (TIGR01509 family)